MSRVILVEQPKIDVGAASEFGELTFLFGRNDRRAQMFDSAQFGRDILRRFNELEFDPKEDTFCVAGSAVATGVALSVLACTFMEFKVLFFDARESAYRKCTLGGGVFRDT